MLLRFTFVPWDLVRLPWQRRRGVRQPARGESRLRWRWPSLPRGASGRPLWGSGFALDREEEETHHSVSFKCLKVCRPKNRINRCSYCPLLELLQQHKRFSIVSTFKMNELKQVSNQITRQALWPSEYTRRKETKSSGWLRFPVHFNENRFIGSYLLDLDLEMIYFMKSNQKKYKRRQTRQIHIHPHINQNLIDTTHGILNPMKFGKNCLINILKRSGRKQSHITPPILYFIYQIPVENVLIIMGILTKTVY